MSRTVLFTGGNSSPELAEPLRSYIETAYNTEAIAVPLDKSTAMSIDELKILMNGANAVFHSAAFNKVMKSQELSPTTASLYNSSLNVGIPQMLVGSQKIAARHLLHSITGPERGNNWRANPLMARQMIREGMRYSPRNLPFWGCWNENSVLLAARIAASGIPAKATYTDRDEYFPSSKLPNRPYTVGSIMGPFELDPSSRLQVVYARGTHNQVLVNPPSILTQAGAEPLI